MSKDIEIMDMPNGTKLKHKKSGWMFILGDWVNNRARKISASHILVEPYRTDYINRNTQYEYEVWSDNGNV